jgi:hypothetical protein
MYWAWDRPAPLWAGKFSTGARAYKNGSPLKSDPQALGPDMVEDQEQNARVETGIEEPACYAGASKGATPAPDGFDQSTAPQLPGLKAGQANHISETLKAAESYIRAGWRTFPGKRGNHDHRDKQPKAGWLWKNTQLTLADAPKYFGADQHNVLVALGKSSANLIDIDLDWPEATAAADVLLNDLPSFGRNGKPRSHRLARCNDIKSKKYLLPQSLANHPNVVNQQEHKMCIAEVRSSGAYTVFPGSEHQTGQKVEWTDNSTDNMASIPDTEADGLIKKMGLLAFVAFCMRFFPAVGARCDFMMAVAGSLARAGCGAELIQRIVQSIGAFNHDEGTNGSWSVAAGNVTDKLGEGKEVTGLPTLIKILGFGDEVLKWCREMLGNTSYNVGGPAINGAHNPKRCTSVKFRDVDKLGNQRPTLANAMIAIQALGIEVRFDLFHYRIKVSYHGDVQTIQEGLLTDDTVGAVRILINDTYCIDCGDADTLAAIKGIARQNAYDPVLDYLSECQGRWDGVKRIDTWVIKYLGCEDTPLNREIGRLTLIAAVRRARKPGCKFDNIIVLEGVEGTNKSSVIQVLAGDENFSDQSVLGVSDREVQEQLEGIWLHESADLTGMRKAEVEKIKAHASRQVDRARRAYGRVREDIPRRSVPFGTTNDGRYLQSQTGNRRFWPLATGHIDLDSLIRDRNQLWGEAATYEASGQSITLSPLLWGAARDAQEDRRVMDPWEDLVASIPDTLATPAGIVTIIHKSGDGYERVASADLLTHVLQVPKAQQNSGHGQRLARVMEHTGWNRNPTGRVTIGGVVVRGYLRPSSGFSIGQNITATAPRVPFQVAKNMCERAMGVEETPPEIIDTGICDLWADGLTP